MSVLYVKEQGAYIVKNGERITVIKNDQRLLDLPVFQLENLAIVGNVQITTQALHMLMREGVDVSFFHYSGTYLGHLQAESSANIFLRFEQYRLYQQTEKRLSAARIIVDNKIQNQISIIRNHRWTGTDYDWKEDIRKLEKYRRTLSQKKTQNEILGVEGVCSRVYFQVFGKLLKCDFTFSDRNRRPPRDPVNVMLSLSYTLLTKEIICALDAESFEPYLGFLHGIRYGRKSLALDVIEEFRQPAVDRFVLMLFNKRMIRKDDFSFSEDGKVELEENGLKSSFVSTNAGCPAETAHPV